MISRRGFVAAEADAPGCSNERQQFPGVSAVRTPNVGEELPKVRCRVGASLSPVFNCLHSWYVGLAAGSNKWGKCVRFNPLLPSGGLATKPASQPEFLIEGITKEKHRRIDNMNHVD